MHRDLLRQWMVSLGGAMTYLHLGLMVPSSIAGQNQILKITVGEPTTLGPLPYVNKASLSVSRTGVVAAFIPRHDPAGIFVRSSSDGGVTWSNERPSPIRMGGACGTALRDGGVIRMISHSYHLRDNWPLIAYMARFADDFSTWTVEAASVDLPNVALTPQEPSPHTWAGPIFDKGKMVQLPSGDVLAPMYGRLKGDTTSRVLLTRSSDGGRTWRYHATVAYDQQDPYPEIPGDFGGYAEPSIALLPNGQILCVMRAQYSHLPPDYKPLHASWSNDDGKTWTRPAPTRPHLRTIWPTLQVLDNGVLACVHGRPGFHVAFSTDGGHTWGHRVSFAHQPEPHITGQVDMVKTGPNKLLAIGGVPGGTKVFPVTVERVNDPSPGPFKLAGSVQDHRGTPIVGAKVELGPNRYTTEYRPIRPEHGNPMVRTNDKGLFRFDSVKRGKTTLTVEADGYVPAVRHITARPGMEQVELTMKPGRAIQGRVVNEAGEPIAGSCVIINEKWHTHTGRNGAFHWLVHGDPPGHAKVRLVRRGYLQQCRTLSLAEIRRPIMTYRLPYPKDGPSLRCARVSLAPAIDAGFDNVAWAEAPVAIDFWVRAVLGTRLIPLAARFACDAECLYAIVRVGVVKDAPTSDEDVLELYLAKDMDHRKSYQFAYNASGAVGGDFAWNVTRWSKVCAKRDPEGGWTVATAIKWLVLGMRSPGRGTSIGVGLAHIQNSRKEQATRNSSLQAAPPTVFRYGRLVIE